MVPKEPSNGELAVCRQNGPSRFVLGEVMVTEPVSLMTDANIALLVCPVWTRRRR